MILATDKLNVLIHETGLVTLTLKEEVDLKILEKAINNLGFEVKAN